MRVVAHRHHFRQVLVVRPDPGRQRSPQIEQDWHGDLRVLAAHPPEIRARDLQQVHLGIGISIGDSRAAVEEADLAEHATRLLDACSHVGNAGDTEEGFAARLPFGKWNLDEFRVLNGLSSSDVLKTGQKVKIVVKATR